MVECFHFAREKVKKSTSFKRIKRTSPLSDDSETARNKNQCFCDLLVCISFFSRGGRGQRNKERKDPLSFSTDSPFLFPLFHPNSSPSSSLDGFTLASANTGLIPTTAIADHSATCALCGPTDGKAAYPKKLRYQ